MTRTKYILLIVAVVAVTAQSLWISTKNRELTRRLDAYQGRELVEGDVVWGVVGVDADGLRQEIRLDDGTSHTLVFGFSFECPACIPTFPLWLELEKRALSIGLRTIWVSKDLSVGGRKEGLAQAGISGTVIFDPSYATWGQLRLGAVPTTTLIGPDGRVRRSWFGNLSLTGSATEIAGVIDSVGSPAGK